MIEHHVRLEKLAVEHKSVMPYFPEDMLAKGLEHGAHFFAVYHQEKCIGLVGVRLTPDPETPEIFVFIDPKESHKGYATAATARMLKMAFEDMQLPVIYARCRRGRAAAHIAEKLGFRRYGDEGDEVYYVLMRADWLPGQ